MNQPGILGTGASLASDISVLAYILLIVPSMLIGFFFARRKMFEPYHKMTMTTIVFINWIIIFFLMAVSYREGVLPAIRYAPTDPRIALPTIHLVTGLTAQLLGTYLVARMWLEKILPKWIMVRRIKRYMRFTLALWLFTASLGIIIYAIFYIRPVRAGDGLAPVTTPEVVVTDEVDPITTEDITPEVTPDTTDEAFTPEVTPDVTAEVEIIYPTPMATEDITPVQTPEVTPEVTPDVTQDAYPPVETEEGNDGDDGDDDHGGGSDDDGSNSGSGSGGDNGGSGGMGMGN
ncbi:MAG TPA: hypothetical protein VHL11_20560 [Phototrophicaceae bacterium]|jgi:uncharacterized membrane protein YgcG|nr:hypothetical protein [Phototrophicaceae bacterium]